MRLHELAKELGVATNNLIKFLQDAGFDIKGALNVIGDEEVKYARERLETKRAPEPTEKAPSRGSVAGGTKKKVFIRKTATIDPRGTKVRAPSGAPSQIRPTQIPPKRPGVITAKPGTAAAKKPPVKPAKPAEPIQEILPLEVEAPELTPEMESRAPRSQQETGNVEASDSPTAVEKRGEAEPRTPERERPRQFPDKQRPGQEKPGSAPGKPKPGYPPRHPQDRPPRRDDQQRPPQRGDQQRPPQRGDQQRPPQRGDQQRPPQRGDQQRPPQRGDQQRPPQRGDQQRPPQRGDQQRPPQRGDQQRPPRRDDQQRPPRRDDQRPPQRDDKGGSGPRPQGYPPRDDQRRRDPRFDKSRPPSDRPKFSKEEALRVASEKRRGPMPQRPKSQYPDKGGVSGMDALGLQKAPQAPGGFKRKKRKGKDGGGPPSQFRQKETPKNVILEGQAFDQGIMKLKDSFKASVEAGAAAKGKRRKKILPVDKKRSKAPLKSGKRDASEYGGRSLLVKRHKRKKQADIIPGLTDLKPETHKKIRVTDHMTIKDLSAVTGVRSPAIMKFLLDELKLMVNINQVIDKDMVALVLENLGFEYEVTVKQVEDVLKHVEDTDEDLKRRPPVVTVLGHVDHGKTRLLDTIRRTNVAAHEAGGITQAIGAYQVKLKGRSITFIDTPGHEAFTAMRARGAKVTDVAILVVACDDGVQPQTLEAIDHARSAGIEIIVALNKVDLGTADVERTKGQLAEVGLIPEEWGGKTVMVPISAKFGQGIDELLELVLLQADLLDLKANPDAMAVGTIIEARIDRGKGALATVLVQRGTLHVGDYIVAGCSHGHLRAMLNEWGQEVPDAGPSVPVELFGLSDVPQAGDILNQVETEKIAKEIYDKRYLDRRRERIRAVTKISLEDLYAKIKEGEAKELNLIIKADMQGSIEAIIHALKQLDSPEVQIKFIHASVGNVKESDIMLALASKAIIIGFNVVVSAEMKKLAAMEGIDIRAYNIIYKAVEDIEKAMKGLLEPEFEEKIIGIAEVRAIFKKAKGTIIAGLIVSSGSLKRGGEIRILRNGEKIWSGKLNSLKRFTDDAREVDAGLECGISLDSITDLAEGDLIEEFEMVEKPRV